MGRAEPSSLHAGLAQGPGGEQVELVSLRLADDQGIA